LAKVKTKENSKFDQNNHRKKVSSSVPKVGTAVVAIDNHMAIIQINIGKNTI
jgi:hypothetical protein